MSWREASLEWVEGANPVHLTDKLAEIVPESTLNSFTLNTLGETESLVAKEVRRAEERLAGSSISLVEFPSSSSKGESFSRYQSLYSTSLVSEEAQIEDIRSIQVNPIVNQIIIFVFSQAMGSNVLASWTSRKLENIQLAWVMILAQTLLWQPLSARSGTSKARHYKIDGLNI